VLVGNGVANAVFGYSGNDELRGLDGNDWLDGGPGNDFLHGGSGRDWCTTGEAFEACESSRPPGDDLRSTAVRARTARASLSRWSVVVAAQ